MCDEQKVINDRDKQALEMAIKALEQEPKTGWNNHQIACMLADLFGDACACNYNGIDEWLGELCDFKDTCCPNPVGVACWEQFLKYSQSRYTECGYEVRDKNALQEPKTIQEKQAESEKYQKAFDDGYKNGYAQARFDYEQEPCEDANANQHNSNALNDVGQHTNALKEDAISRQAVIDIIHLFFTEEVDKIPTKKTEDGEVLIMCKAQPLFAMNKTLCKRIKALPSVTAEPQENDHKCHTCKHYTSGEHDGSCGSYICKGYSNWESEVSDADSN